MSSATPRASRLTSRTILQAREIRAIIESGTYRTSDGALVSVVELRRRMIDESRVVDSGGQHVGAESGQASLMRMNVRLEDTVEAVFRLASCGSRVGVLNFASGQHRGGGFDLGASAQEEALCRSSLLIAALESSSADHFYEMNARTFPVFSDAVYFSPAVPFVRHAGRLVDHPVLADVYTVAAPRADVVSSRGSQVTEKMLTSRLNALLSAPEMKALDHLVLGAWGCGEYGNDPRTVARAFRSALASTESSFKSVTFSILDRSPDREVIGPFEEVVSNRWPLTSP